MNDPSEFPIPLSLSLIRSITKAKQSRMVVYILYFLGQYFGVGTFQSILVHLGCVDTSVKNCVVDFFMNPHY